MSIEKDKLKIGSIQDEIKAYEIKVAAKMDAKREKYAAKIALLNEKIELALTQSLVRNTELFLELTPKHSFSSCNDESYEGVRRGCERCVFLFIGKNPHAAENYEVKFTVMHK